MQEGYRLIQSPTHAILFPPKFGDPLTIEIQATLINKKDHASATKTAPMILRHKRTLQTTKIKLRQEIHTEKFEEISWGIFSQEVKKFKLSKYGCKN